MENISHHHLGSVLPNESDPDGTGLHGVFYQSCIKDQSVKFWRKSGPGLQSLLSAEVRCV